MFNHRYIIKVLVKSTFLLGMMMMLANCNQFASFSSTEQDVHLSTNPVFENPEVAFNGGNAGVGNDPIDDGIAIVDPPTPQPQPIPVVDPDPQPQPQPTPPVITPPATPTPQPQPPAVTPPVVQPPVPPFRFCPDGTFQVRRPNGTFTRCRPCLTQGFVQVNDVNVPICAVQRCSGENQFIFFGNDPANPSRSCRRCDVLSNDQTSCRIVVRPPAPIPPPLPPVIDPPTPPQPPVIPPPPVCNRCNDTPNTPTGGDGGGDGGGDPLMVDTIGVEYANEAELVYAQQDLRNSDSSYFNSGDFSLTDPHNEEDDEERKNFKGFNLLGEQTNTVLDDGNFLLINESGKNFRFQELSWTRKDQKRYRFVALPNEKGQVLGINQLFGDNTVGPDNRFSADGFHALSKWDLGNAADPDMMFNNGFIDREDAIYSKLRVWHDANGDGDADGAQPGEIEKELLPLDHPSVGIAYIHLKMNEKFYETDHMGNDIAYKSIVGFYSEGEKLRLGTAFDLWLQYDPNELFEEGHAIKVDR